MNKRKPQETLEWKDLFAEIRINGHVNTKHMHKVTRTSLSHFTEESHGGEPHDESCNNVMWWSSVAFSD
jgi:hypothetical protein